MRVSIVINTYNRRSNLQETLASLRQLRYRDFEVVVVNGPSTDGTDDLLAAWRSSIKIARCPVANLAVSRNIGIAAAAGDIVAFIDDDAIPDPQWLGNIVAGYDSDEIGGVGGLVYDSTGYEFQTKYIICDRFGGATIHNDFDPTDLFNVPGAPRYAAHLGTNTSFRRALLLEIGGFDEEFAYYLDETDVCLRVVDSGHVVKYVDDAFVYHKFAPSHLRNERKSLVTRYEILKNQAYFAFKHGAPAIGHLEAMQSIVRFAAQHRDEVDWCVREGSLPPSAIAIYESEQRRAIPEGIERARRGRRTYLARATLAAQAAAFKRFDRTRLAEDRLTLCLFSRQFPPDPTDGIGRSVCELAAALAELGHTVHVLTTSETHSRVDLEDGVWVHRLAIADHVPPIPDIPRHVWSYSRSLMDEVDRIDRLDRVDLIEAPAWDCEGIAALFADRIPVVTSLHTPMLIAASMHPQWLIDATVVEKTFIPLTKWERTSLLFSDGLSANTGNIIDTIEREYDIAIDRTRTRVVSRGLRDRARAKALPSGSDEIRVLFVGRLEYRKGIDLVIGALRELLPEHPELRADIIGQDAAHDDDMTFSQKFTALAAGADWASHVKFHGRVDQECLDGYLAACDIFVAPSRFESFGLIYLEAMMFGKPVIGTNAGGIGEVVAHEQTGLLVGPGDQGGFTQALRRLVRSRDLRTRLGDAGRDRFLTVFTPRATAERSIALYKEILARPVDIRRPQCAATDVLELTRRCELSEFWTAAPLYPVLSAIGSGVIDRRLWAYGIAVLALTRKRGTIVHDRKPRALIITDRPIPAPYAHAPDWKSIEIFTIADPASAPFSVAKLGYDAGCFDLVSCLLVLDPLDDGFTAAIAELARICAPGGSLHLVVALGAAVARRAPIITDLLECAGLQSKLDLNAFLRSAPHASPFHAESVEPFLAAHLHGEGRAVATLELERAAVGHGMARPVRSAAVTAP